MKQIVIALAARMERALVLVVAHTVRAQNLNKAGTIFDGQPRAGKYDAVERAGRCGQKRGHAKFAGQPCPDQFLARKMVFVGGPTPAVPADLAAIDAHAAPPVMLSIAD